MRRLSTILLASGAVVCVIGALGLVVGAWANLPPAAVRAIAMALPFVVGGVLLVVGALVGRVASRAAVVPPVAPPAVVPPRKPSRTNTAERPVIVPVERERKR